MENETKSVTQLHNELNACNGRQKEIAVSKCNEENVILLSLNILHSREEYVKLIREYIADELFNYIQENGKQKNLVVKKQVQMITAYPDIVKCSLFDDDRVESFNPRFDSVDKYKKLKKRFIFIIGISNTEEDSIALLQYLVMLRHIIVASKKNEAFVLFDTEQTGETFPYKISSYLLFEFFKDLKTFRDCTSLNQMDLRPIFKNELKCGYNHFYQYNNKSGRFARLPLKYNISSEWLPVLFLSLKSTKVAEKNTFFVKALEDDSQNLDIINVENYFDKGKNTLDLLKLIYEKGKYISSYECFVKIILQAICESIRAKTSNETIGNKIVKATGAAPLFVKCLFYIAINAQTKGKNVVKYDNIDKLCYQCYDCFELMYQLLENAQYYSKSGGLLSIRANTSKSASDDKRENLPFQLTSNFKNYFRISIMDYSEKSIGENVRVQSGIQSLTLNQIFGQNTSLEYDEYLRQRNNIVHHYGLSTLSSLVAANQGLFLVVSSMQTNLEDDLVQEDDICLKCDNEEIKQIGSLAHVPGTFYDIILPLADNIEEKSSRGIASIDMAPITHDLPLLFESKFDWSKCSFSVDFYDSDSKIIMVEKLAEKLGYEIRKNNNKLCLFDLTYFELSLSDYELVAKAIMKAIMQILDDQSIKGCYLAFIVPNRLKFIKFVRQFALIYDKCDNNIQLRRCQIYIREYRNEEKDDLYVPAETILAGDSIQSVYESSLISQLNSGFPTELSSFFDHLARRNLISYRQRADRTQNENLSLIKLIPFEDIIKLNGDFSWLPKLMHVVKTDIHERYIGCRMPNVHVPVSKHKVHLSDFYEAQFLFANAYWSNKFSQFLIDQIGETSKIDKILLVGYETYSEPLICQLKAKLTNGKFDRDNVRYVIVENEKYVTGRQKAEERLHYEEGINDFLNIEQNNAIKNIIILFVVGISVTLSTFEQMFYKIVNSIAKQSSKEETEIIGLLTNEFNILNCSILQIVAPQGRTEYQNQIITIDRQEKTVRRTDSSTSAIDTVRYLCVAETDWYDPESCPLCYPKVENLERPLLQLDETSVIPFQLIEANVTKNQSDENDFPQTYHCDFTEDETNKIYLNYCHSARGDNHFQYYIKTRDFLSDSFDHDAPDTKIYKWLSDIKNSLHIGKESSRTLNIIVTSSHFSNQKLVNKVNECVFDNKAYILDFNVKKEFRSNFEAKFINYKDVINLLNEFSEKSIYEQMSPPVINCYFVDDCIISGETFHRSKDLLTGLFNNYADPKVMQRVKVQLFKGIIVAIDRNSAKSRKYLLEKSRIFENGEFLEKYPFYSYIELDIPSIRTYGDSCPLCKKVADAREMLVNCQLNDMDYTWREKAFYHRLRPISTLDSEKGEDVLERNFYRLQCENDLWKTMKKPVINGANMALQILDSMYKRILPVKPEKQIEYLISYLKVLSRPFLYYREKMKPVAINILKACYSLFVGDTEAVCQKHKLYRLIKRLLGNSQEKVYGKIADLYKLIIVRLCTIHSNFLITTSREQYGEKIKRAFEKLKSLCGQNYSEKDGLIFKYALKVYSAEYSYARRLLLNLEKLIENSAEPIYRELYIEIAEENDRKTFLKNLDFDKVLEADGQQRDDKDRIKKYYSSMAEDLCCLTHCKEIGFYTSVDVRTMSHNGVDVEIRDISTNKTIMTKQTFSGFYCENWEKGIYWLTVDNNYCTLTDENSCSLATSYKTYVTDKHDMSLAKTYTLYIKIETQKGLALKEQLEVVKKIAYCREILLQSVCENFNNNAVMLANENEEKKKALSIEKAMSHPFGKQYYNTPYDDWIGLEINDADEKKINAAFSEKNKLKLLADRLLLMQANDWLVKMYQAIVLGGLFSSGLSQSTFIAKHRNSFKMAKHLIVKLCKGEFQISMEDASILINCKELVCPNKEELIIENGSIKSSRNITMCVPSRVSAIDSTDSYFSLYSFPFLMLLILLAENAIKHGGAKAVSFSIEGEDKIKYLVCKNKVSDSEDLKQKVKTAKWKSEEMSEDSAEQSITLWTLKRYCEGVVENMNGDINKAFIIEEDGANFIIKLQIICFERLKK